MDNLKNFARKFLEERNNYLYSANKYDVFEMKKVIERLQFFSLKRIGFRFFYSLINGMCAAVITNDSMVKIAKVDDIYEAIYNFVVSYSVVNRNIFKIKNTNSKKSMFELRSSKLTNFDVSITLTPNVRFANVDETSEMLWVNSEIRFPLEKSGYSFISIRIPVLYFASLGRFTEDKAENLFLEIVNLVRFANEKNIESIDVSKEHLKELLNKFESLLSKDSKEKEIERFLKENFILLKMALNVENPIYQPKLPDSDMQPDLIAFDFKKEDWVIIEYKLSKYEKLVKGKKRKRFYDFVQELMAQLREYIEYFDDSKNRDIFKKKYGKEVGKKPLGVGLIGNLKNPKEKDDFKEARKRVLHYGLEILTYGELLNVLKKYFE